MSPEDEDMTLANVAPPKVMEEEEVEDALAAEDEEDADGTAPVGDGASDASGDAHEKSSED